jgi:hypothetical protein
MTFIKKSITLFSTTLLMSGLAMQTTAAGANERVNLGGLEAIIDFEDLIRNRLEPEFNRDEGQRGLLERKITLYPRNPMFGGRHNDRDTAFLKVMTQQQYPRIAQNLQNYRLQSVKVTGKSQSRRFSTSTISFEIDGQYEDQAVIGQGRHPPPRPCFDVFAPWTPTSRCVAVEVSRPHGSS